MPSEGGNIFPIYINLQKISDEEYRFNPTPESIALCDYFIANAVFDGSSAYELSLNTGDLYIDDIEVKELSTYGDKNGIIGTYSSWWPYHERYDDFLFPIFEICWDDRGSFPKGTFSAYDDE